MTRPGILPIIKFPDDLSEHVMPDPVTAFTVLTPQTVKRECSGSSDTDIDDQGYDFETCPNHDGGHLWLHGWCVHCHSEEP